MSDDSINDIEATMYETLLPGKPQIKVAMLIGPAFRTDNLPDDDLIDAALMLLAKRQDIQTFGAIKRWRHSEISRLPIKPS